MGEVEENDVASIFRNFGLQPLKVRVLKDDTGRSKGCAFVDFASEQQAQEACRFDGSSGGPMGKRLKINPANNKPGGTR